mmetsp:Transcript_4780/g.30258  ORF Transcript_4780/g.30258 Transcript_4780/m.30258 type:complete len:105 (+) Transcript_4780:2380-2694(+)
MRNEAGSIELNALMKIEKGLPHGSSKPKRIGDGPRSFCATGKGDGCSLQQILTHEMLGSSIDVFVTTTTAVDHELCTFRESWTELLQISKCMRCFQGRNDAFQT